MNDNANNDERDSSGGRISSHRRGLTDIALATVATGNTIARLAKLVDRIPSARRRLEILVACDEIATLRATIEAAEMHLREVADDVREERYVTAPKPSWVDRTLRFLLGDPP